MKIKLFTLGFCNSNIFNITMQRLYQRGLLSEKYEHFFLWQHYPLPTIEQNKIETQNICNKYGINWLDSEKDRGFSYGFNYLTSLVKPNEDDIIICFDPDEYPTTQGWDKAMIEVLTGNDRIAYCCLDNVYAIGDSPGLMAECKRSNGHRIIIPKNRPTMIGLSAFKWSWLKSIGGMKQITNYYGHIESYLWEQLNKTNKQYAIILDFKETYDNGLSHDAAYTLYKQEQAAFKTNTSFEEWLKK